MKNRITPSLRGQIMSIRKTQDALALVELLIVILIMGILGAVAIPMTINAHNRATGGTSPSASTSTSAAPSVPVAGPAPVTRAAPAAEFPWGIVLGIGVSAILAVAFVALVVWFVRKNKAAVTNSRNNIAGWEKLIARHRELRAQWASYEIDMAKLIDFPLMTDMREPTTVALHKALKKAADLEPESAKKMSSQSVAGSDFSNAVNELDAAFHTAEQTAKKVAWSRFTADERKSLATAKNLLALAMDSGASPSERQAAYKRVFKELQGLIEFPEKARLEIEARHQLSIAA